MYTLLSIFIIIPLIFSHTFARLGEYFIIDNGIGSFESVKGSIFFFLLFVASIEILLKDPHFLSKKTIKIFSSLIAFVFFEYFLFGGETLFGIGEKQHGSLFFASLIWFGYLLSTVQNQYFPLFRDAIVATATMIALSAVIEFLFSYNIFSGFLDYSTHSWGERRATVTLGNPNYVAGYLLMILPLVQAYTPTTKKISITLILLFGIISTGSLIGMALFLLALCSILLKKLSLQNRNIILAGVVIVGLTIMAFVFEGSEKWLSFTSRFVLMRETLIAYFQSISSVVFGNGPNGIIEYYEGMRSEAITSYFPDNMLIDSSHNIFIDILYKFGIFGALALGGILYYHSQNYKRLSSESKGILLLGILFFSFNVVILCAYILFIFALTEKDMKH